MAVLFRPGRNLAAMLMVGVLLPDIAYGQVYERIAPKPLPDKPAVAVPAPPAPATGHASDQVVLPALKGLVFVARPQGLQKDGVATDSAGANGIAAPDLPLLNDPGFTAQLKSFLNAKLTLADLDRIAQLTSDWYRKHDKPFMSVAVPAQNISSGVVQVVVSDYRVGQVTTQGNRWFSDDQLIGASGLMPGQTLTLSGVQDDLDWLNANPFRTVNTLFKPGAEPGITDVTLQTDDRLPLRVYSSFDNAGVTSLGRSEWSVGANWGNAFGLDQQLSYQFTRSDTGRFNAHAVSWAAPLPWRDKLIVFGSFERVRPDIGPDFGETGESGQASLRYVHGLPRLSWGEGIGLSQNIALGYDFKTTNNDLEFGGVGVFSSAVEVSQFPLIYDATLTDAWGQTAIENQFVYSPGGITGANNNAAFQVVIANSTANYVYNRIGLTRVTFLPEEFSWTMRVIGQMANGNLQYSEQLGAGGTDSVRGYYTSTALGSEGILVSNEIRTPALSLANLLGQSLLVPDQMQFGAFWDWGQVAQVDAIPDQASNATLASVGLDAHVTLGRNLDLSVNTGWQLRPAPGQTQHSVFTGVAITASL